MINGIIFGAFVYLDGTQGSQYKATFTSPVIAPNQIFTTSGNFISAYFYPFL